MIKVKEEESTFVENSRKEDRKRLWRTTWLGNHNENNKNIPIERVHYDNEIEDVNWSWDWLMYKNPLNAKLSVCNTTCHVSTRVAQTEDHRWDNTLEQ